MADGIGDADAIERQARADVLAFVTPKVEAMLGAGISEAAIAHFLAQIADDMRALFLARVAVLQDLRALPLAGRPH